GNLTYPVIGGLGAKVAGGIGSFIAKSIYSLTGYNAAFNALFKGAEHLQDNYLNPGGIRKSIANNYRNVYSRVQKIFAPAYLLTANGINTIAGLPTFALNALPLGYYNSIKPPVGEKKAEAPAQNAAASTA
ncbi:hypothetical protein JXA85_06145, partial [Candidatus Woesearchaeota archaeon]|nr:hypothetical protein [Candidatus Woesearchaeota archaeon]